MLTLPPVRRQGSRSCESFRSANASASSGSPQSILEDNRWECGIAPLYPGIHRGPGGGQDALAVPLRPCWPVYPNSRVPSSRAPRSPAGAPHSACVRNTSRPRAPPEPDPEERISLRRKTQAHPCQRPRPLACTAPRAGSSPERFPSSWQGAVSESYHLRCDREATSSTKFFFSLAINYFALSPADSRALRPHHGARRTLTGWPANVVCDESGER